MQTIADLWAFHKENLILTAAAAAIFALIYEPAAHFLRRYLRNRYP